MDAGSDREGSVFIQEAPLIPSARDLFGGALPMVQDKE
jgi:hypothetical protein